MKNLNFFVVIVFTLFLQNVNAQSTSSFFSISGCDTYTVPSGDETYTISGVYMDTIPNSIGGDSIMTIDVTIYSSVTSLLDVTTCDSFQFNNMNFASSGIYIYTGTTVHGCDSTVALDLTINNSSVVDLSIDTCANYYWTATNTTYTTSGLYTANLTSINGCDSIVNLDLTINSPTNSTSYVTECDSLNWNGTWYYTSGVYSANLINSVGCDSIATVVATVVPSYSINLIVTACNVYVFNGVNLTNSGIYTYNGITSNGCDSTVTLDLTIIHPVVVDEYIFTCSNYTWPVTGLTYDSSGVYSVSYPVLGSCDSTVNLYLTIYSTSESIDTLTACDSLNWNGIWYSTSGIYSDTLTGASMYGCDSIATVILTIVSPTSSSEQVTSCEDFTWGVNGNVYTQSGIYVVTGLNAGGCIHTDSLVLTINNPTFSDFFVSECENYTFNGITYTQSGTYSTTLTNSAGCDSIVTLYLTISADVSISLIGSSLTASITGADAYQWADCNNLNGSGYPTPIIGATNQSFTPTEDGSYAVYITTNGCDGLSNCLTITSVGIAENSISDIDKWKLYPNPTNGSITIEFGEVGKSPFVNIYTVSGVLMKSKEFENLSETVSLNIEGSTGFYMIEIIDQNHREVYKVLKQ